MKSSTASRYFLEVFILFLLPDDSFAAFAATGCSFTQASTERATCDFPDWDPPLMENQFGPGDVYQIYVEKVDGTIPTGAFSGIESKTNSFGKDPKMMFQCDLENIILSDNVFTDNLDWIEKLTFDGCYIQGGIASNSLANLTALQEFEVLGGIIGPLTTDSFAGLSNLRTMILQADFLDPALPTGLFSSHPLLESIDLRSSGVTDIPADTFTGLDQLTTLDLRENGLTTLPEGLFQSLTSLNTVELENNAWDCTCDLAWLATWSLYTGVTINVDCSTPSEFAGIALNRAVATLGCLDSLSVVTSASGDTGSSGSGGTATSGTSDSGSTSDDSRDWMTYAALGVAGFASIIAVVTSTVLCVKYCKSKPKSSWKTKVKPNNKQPPSSPPPSYRSQTGTTDRMFMTTPMKMYRDTRAQPLLDVKYHP